MRQEEAITVCQTPYQTHCAWGILGLEQIKACCVHLTKISKVRLFFSCRNSVKLRQELLGLSQVSCLILSPVNLGPWASVAADLSTPTERREDSTVKATGGQGNSY